MPISSSESQTKAFAKELLKKYPNKVFCLFGDLGSGKTVLAKGVGEFFGLKNIKSPTYTILREYNLKNGYKLYHYDFYRFNKEDEILSLNFEEHLADKGNIVIIEWAEKINKYLPKNRVEIYLKYIDENSREIRVK